MVGRIHQRLQLGAEQLLRTVAEHTAGRGTLVGDGAASIHHKDHVGGVLHQRPQPGLTVPQRLLHPLTLRDVHEDQHGADRAAVFNDRAKRVRDGERRSIGPDEGAIRIAG